MFHYALTVPPVCGRLMNRKNYIQTAFYTIIASMAGLKGADRESSV